MLMLGNGGPYTFRHRFFRSIMLSLVRPLSVALLALKRCELKAWSGRGRGDQPEEQPGSL